MHIPQTETLKITYFLQPCARRAPRNPPNYIYSQSVGIIYPIFFNIFGFFLQILSIFESLSSKSHFDATLRTEFLAPKYLIIFVLKVVCPQSRMSSKSSVLKVASSKSCPQRRTSSLSHSPLMCRIQYVPILTTWINFNWKREE